jgi:hypothetical protein
LVKKVSESRVVKEQDGLLLVQILLRLPDERRPHLDVHACQGQPIDVFMAIGLIMVFPVSRQNRASREERVQYDIMSCITAKDPKRLK